MCLPGRWCGWERINGLVVHWHMSEPGRWMQFLAGHLLILAGESLGVPGRDLVPSTLIFGANHFAVARTTISRHPLLW